MEVALRVLLPKLLDGVTFEVYQYQDKPRLLRVLPKRLRAYEKWLPPTWRIMVVVDQDDDDCQKLKAKLERMTTMAGLTTRTQSARNYVVVNRIAIEELEAWYFGDWDAVLAAYPRAETRVPAQAGYRDPDSIKGGTWERLESILQQAGYFKSGLLKMEAAQMIAPCMVPARNRSRSFQVFRDALLEMARR
ncbi:MAG: DUF4276 family protein [Candidatus Lambdaproteobacteria bacterium]|nr:DUF4276 family protein [Candidatus Lambdaproteobacteria bacterium]